MYFKMFCGLAIALFLSTSEIVAQATQDSTTRLGIVENADNQVYDFSGADTLLYLNGNVRMYKDSTLIYCDTSTIKNNTTINAYGHVVIVRHDSIRLFSDTLRYEAKDSMAYVRENVVLQSGSGTLYTSSASYDIARDIAAYRDTALLTNGLYEIKSKVGKLYTLTNTVAFRRHVTIEGENTYIKTDSLNYNINSGQAAFLSPVYMRQGDKKIYAQGGTYNTKTKSGQLTKKVEIKGKDLEVSARTMVIRDGGKIYELYDGVEFSDLNSSGTSDTLIYNTVTEEVLFRGNVDITQEDGSKIKGDEVSLNRKTDAIAAQKTTLFFDTYEVSGSQISRGTGDGALHLHGDVTVVDTTQNIYAMGNSGIYHREEKTFTITDSTDQALFFSINGTDTLYTLADTLHVSQEVDSLDAQGISAYRNVSILNADIQASADSLQYSGVDSSFVLHHNPMMWGDSSQFSADTIRIFLQNNKIKSMRLESNAATIYTVDMELFSVIRSMDANIYFENDSPAYAEFIKDVDVKYFLSDEGAYLGLNDSKGNEMTAQFRDKKLESIFFKGKQDSEIHPMEKLSIQDLNQGRSEWSYETRPTMAALKNHRARIQNILEKY